MHFFEEKCTFFAYFLYIPAKSEKIWWFCWICILDMHFWGWANIEKYAFFSRKNAYFFAYFLYIPAKSEKIWWFCWICILDMHFWGWANIEKYAFFRGKMHIFLHIFCIFQQKVRKSGDFVGYAFWICIFGAGGQHWEMCIFSRKNAYFLHISLDISILDMHFGYAFLGARPTLKICIFSRKNAHFLHIFCIFQQKVRKSGDFVGYAFWICIFGAGPTLRNVHFFEEKCIFFGYFCTFGIFKKIRKRKQESNEHDPKCISKMHVQNAYLRTYIYKNAYPTYPSGKPPPAKPSSYALSLTHPEPRARAMIPGG